MILSANEQSKLFLQWNHANFSSLGQHISRTGLYRGAYSSSARKPFIWRKKSDANDTRAICEAFSRPDICFVPVKQQDLKAIRRVRHVWGRTGRPWRTRTGGLVAEYGVVLPISIKALRYHLPLAL